MNDTTANPTGTVFDNVPENTPDHALQCTTEHTRMAELRAYIGAHIVGQHALVERMLIALLCGGHLLVEGAPGLAKTRAIRTLCAGIQADFQRIQFTPDLLPSDIIGSDMYRASSEEFVFQKGPLFHNLILADEINRAPAKVQSALLEAMAEHHISVGQHTYDLPDLFLVMATQNPIEQEGTYPLPEAQLDRFLMHVVVDYPSRAEERDILRLVQAETTQPAHSAQAPNLSPTEILAMRPKIAAVAVPDMVETYIVELVMATRNPAAWDNDLAAQIEYGASPRATVALLKSAQAAAWLNGKAFISAHDVQMVIADILRHRLVLSIDAEAAGVTTDEVIARMVELVPAL